MPPRLLLKDRAYEDLKGLILQEVFPPGSFLSERQLTSQLDMSKTPIRAALERLESEGLVTVSPQQGILVREVPLHEIVDIFDVRIALECFVVKNLAGNLTEEQWHQVNESLNAQDTCAEGADVQRCTMLDADFHLMLCSFLGNREIVATMCRLRDRLYRIALRVMRHDVGRMKTSCDEHRRIANSIYDGDSVGAVAHVEAHLTYGKQVLVAR
ncbi:MAG: GntR family transcriptional regulator [Candidatus Latescibacteria bacterium]|nr:GntR family transcriptional regulator [Candidatus Latescibacterota bacterium]